MDQSITKTIEKNEKIAILDGNNICYGDKMQEKPSVRNLESAIRYAKLMGYSVYVIIRPSLKYKVDKKERLEELINRGDVIEAPAKADDDIFILKYSEILNAEIIVSNDRFLPYQDEFPLEVAKRTPFMIIEGHFAI